MKQRIYIGFILLTLFFSYSCNDENRGLPNATGGICEIMLVADNAAQLKGEIGDTINHFFNQFLPGMPMPEESFTSSTTTIGFFNNNSMFRTHHAILFININPKAAKNTVEARTDLWAKPQKVVKITATSDTAFYRLFTEYYPSLFRLYRSVEKQRMVKMFSTSPAKQIVDKLKQSYGIEMLVPGGFAESVSNKNFYWIRQKIHRTKQDTELGFLFYFRNYTDTADLSSTRIIHLRDSIVKKYIPGPTEGSYMTTSTEVVLPEFKRTADFSTGLAIETRGLWKVVHDFMGGPFVSYTFIDKYRNRIVTAEGYLYSPGTEQRKFVLQIETILNSIKVIDPQSENKK